MYLIAILENMTDIIISMKKTDFSHVNLIISIEIDSPDYLYKSIKNIHAVLRLKYESFDFWFVTFFPLKKTTATKWGLHLGYVQGHHSISQFPLY